MAAARILRLRIAAAGCAAGCLLLVPARTEAVSARSTDYSLEYATTCGSAGEAQSLTGDYSIVSQATTEGVAGENASSADYSTEPAVGAPAVSSAVADWMLY